MCIFLIGEPDSNWVGISVKSKNTDWPDTFKCQTEALPTTTPELDL